jgi:cell division protein FtsX
LGADVGTEEALLTVGRGVLVALACVALTVGVSLAGSGALHATRNINTLATRMKMNVRMVIYLQKG